MLHTDIVLLFISLVLCVEVPNCGSQYPYDIYRHSVWEPPFHPPQTPVEYLSEVSHLPHHPHQSHNIRSFYKSHHDPHPQSHHFPPVDDHYFEYKRPTVHSSGSSNGNCLGPRGKAGICKKHTECEVFHQWHLPEDYYEHFKCTIYNRWGHQTHGICCPKEPLRENHPEKPSQEHHHEKLPHEDHHEKPHFEDHHEKHFETPVHEFNHKKPFHEFHPEHPLRDYYPNKPRYTTSTRKPTTRDFKCRVVPIKSGPKPIKKEFEISSDLLTSKSINISLTVAEKSLKETESKNKILIRKNFMVQKGTPAAGHLRFTATSDKIVDLGKLGDIFYEISHDLGVRLNLNKGQKISGLRMYNISNIKSLLPYCPLKPKCEADKYRTANGSCNNLYKPKWGQSLTPLKRLLSPAYADGEWAPRISATCNSLPSARLLSQTFIKDVDAPSKKYSLFLMQFGQFLDHDFTSVPLYRFNNQSGIQCCSTDGLILPKKDQHKSCYPIEIPDNDPFYSPHGRKCMNFVRSRIAPRTDCSLGYADQMNALTHWIDASNVYGSDLDQSNELRLGKLGLLKYSNVAGHRILLPLRDTDGDGCTDAVAGKFCFKAGDFRVNEMVGLVVSHLIWFREHNRIATELHKMNENWSDDELYEESRRILIAEYQHIIYNEWLPIIIGEGYMRNNDIFPLEEGHYEGYDSTVDPSIANEFASAAFRMGHSLVQGIVKLFNRLGEKNGESIISENSNNPHGIRAPGRIDDWIRGLTRFPIQSYDNHITIHLNGRLFQPKGMKFGLDLSSLNIQRARDHGVQGYNAYREFCGRERAADFYDFQDVIPLNTIELLKTYYSHVDDVDLWIGGLSENPEQGKLIGPTFACIVGDQFVRSKKGDRYFYDIADQTHSFSDAQLSEIRKASFARILCDNGDNIKEIQPYAFLIPDEEENSLVDCRDDTIPVLDLSLWKHEHDHDEGSRFHHLTS